MRRTGIVVAAVLALAGPVAAQTLDPGQARAVVDKALKWSEGGDVAYVLAGEVVPSGREALAFDSAPGRNYRVVAEGDLRALDLDVCVYGPDDQRVACDQKPNSWPVVDFTARTSGRYRAVLIAHSLDGPSAYAAMLVLRR